MLNITKNKSIWFENICMHRVIYCIKRILKIKNNEKKSFKYTIFTPKKLLFRTISLNEHVSKEVTNEAPWQRADYDVTI